MRANKNFARSDEIRDWLAEQGIILKILHKVHVGIVSKTFWIVLKWEF